jgi:hypothetical protein
MAPVLCDEAHVNNFLIIQFAQVLVTSSFLSTNILVRTPAWNISVIRSMEKLTLCRDEVMELTYGLKI